MAIEVTDAGLPEAIAAIQRAGFTEVGTIKDGPRIQVGANAPHSGVWSAWGKLLSALGLAALAEGVIFRYPDSHTP